MVIMMKLTDSASEVNIVHWLFTEVDNDDDEDFIRLTDSASEVTIVQWLFTDVDDYDNGDDDCWWWWWWSFQCLRGVHWTIIVDFDGGPHWQCLRNDDDDDYNDNENFGTKIGDDNIGSE